MKITLARWLVAIVIYIAIVSLIVLIQPALFFDAEGRIKSWGTATQDGQSIFSLQIVLPILAIVVFYMVAIVELVVG